MFKFLALVVILAVAARAYPAIDASVPAAPAVVPADGQAELAAKNQEVDLEGGDAGAEGTDLKGAETFGFGYYPSVGYGRSYGYGGYGGGWGYGGGYGGYGGWGGYGRGYGYGGYPRRYYW